LNFAPQILAVPRGVSVRKVDLAVELQILSFYQRRRSLGPVSAGVDDPTPGHPASA
jgi:redox-sensing transcriptional repressor